MKGDDLARGNRDAFGAPESVKQYEAARDLQPPERHILTIARASLSESRVLDLGVGGGRTTLHFAPLAKEYVGADYAESMVGACERRFAGKPWRFVHADARALPFDEGAFDLVLFSFNGIDYVSHEDRLKILAEIRRVSRPGARFAFSTHNLLAAEHVLYGDGGFIDRLKRTSIRKRNPPLETLRGRDHAILFDGACKGKILTYYIDPRAQIDQLRDAGFEGTRVFGLATGDELATPEAIKANRDVWVYYLATRA